MSTWKNVGMTYLKYSDLCATHVRNALKEPMKSKAKALGDMHVRIMQWEGGKRGKPGECRKAFLRFSAAAYRLPHLCASNSMSAWRGTRRLRITSPSFSRRPTRQRAGVDEATAVSSSIS